MKANKKDLEELYDELIDKEKIVLAIYSGIVAFVH